MPSGGIACLDELDHLHSSLGLTLLARVLKHVRDRACDIQALHRDPVAAICRRRQLGVVNVVYRHNILLDHTSLRLSETICVFGRSQENDRAIFVLDEIVDLGDGAVVHEHGHADVLDDGTMSLVVRAVCHSNFLINLGDHSGKVLPKMLVVL